MSVTIGDVIDGKYEIVRLLGEGGMGAVYEGRNVLISRRVAIKVLHASLTGAEDVVKRFEREAQAAGRIGSDHILEVLDLGTLPSGDRYMVLEFLDGETVSERITRRGTLTAGEVAPLIKQALSGLSAAHQAGIIHRDLKPDNLFILKEKAGRTDFVKIIDFGISKFGALTGDLSMTSTGAVMGTPYYMSPEQAKGAGGVSHQSDIYSMGVIAYEALTGKVPFDGTTFNDLMFKIVLSELPPLTERAPGVDAKFARIVEKAMAKDLSVRYQSADEFIAALEAWAPSASTVVRGSAPHAYSTGHSEAPPPPGGAKTGAAGTDTAWTNSDNESVAASLPVKKTSKMVYVGAAAGLLLVAGGAFAMMGGSGEAAESNEEDPTAVGVVQDDAAEAAESPVAPEPEKASEKPTPEAKAPAEEAEEPKEEQAKPTPTPAVAPAPKPAVAPKPAAAPAPKPVIAPRPAAQPKPKPKPRDFGY